MKFQVADVSVELAHVTDADYHAIRAHLDQNLAAGGKAREGIERAFAFATNRCPAANPSDLWHHVIYRRFLESSLQRRPGTNPGQSWVRAGGEALEVFFGGYYTPVLAPHSIRLRPLLSRDAKRAALLAMGCDEVVGDAKLDTAIEGLHGGTWRIFGGAHIKASLAERISDDVPTSVQMMKRGYFSPLLTLDVKSFPPRDLVNRGELGTPQRPSEKRKYIEQHGSFDDCYSYNQRTQPSVGSTPSGKRIQVLQLAGAADQFVADCVSRWQAFPKA